MKVSPSLWISSLAFVATTAAPWPAFAQNPTTASTAPDDPAVLAPAEPDFVVINLPTAMRVPLFKGNFRLTHRFAGNLRNGSFAEQAGNLFGLDQGAIIGFEYRVGVARNLQAAFYRSSFEKTIQFYGKYDGIRQHGALPVSVTGLISIEGTNNFQDKFVPATGVVVSRQFGTRAAAYVTPLWAGNTNQSALPIQHEHDLPPAAGDHHAEPAQERRDTFYVGLGGRWRIHGGTYIAGEVAIRAGGYAPDEPAFGFSLEKRVGSHMFSLTFTNSFGTTLGQVARGGAAHSLYLGFNLGRKFF